ncbi:MAG: UDP-N-acetylmuramyl-tripeptide synthetase [Candidatus Woesebacteria bacterium GW2011_GWB1_45_5]|uniref:UDP-N-acetylmuramyl-tripeptide synthetase n=1 Tax=Candidatus Woesebacteria bacterium GW2011_GWB1_45_5 TaxID=1618581 RepID=A0A0G1MQW5_9BACT|nr:MAG: UDP-N-acetylmuramyl-tripeptide synthetase [Candidatus Woesebacteria bacterium GW2011_GWB1_45_5]
MAKELTDDSRKVKKGGIYVAIRGLTSDGHDYIDEAVKNGAVLIYGEKDIKVSGAKYIRVKDSREKLGELASEFYGNPSQKLKIIGITGTKGKTTTSHLIYHILTNLGKKAGLISSISVPGLHVTSPDVITLHRFLKEMVDKGCEYAVIEVSSHGIDQKRTAGVKFDMAALTNIAPEHLDYHKTFAEYKKIKLSFLKSAKARVVSRKETKLNVLPGIFNNLNAQLAVDVVIKLGMDEKSAIASLSSFELPEGRLEEIKNDFGYRIYVDFAHTPDSLQAILKYLRSKTKGRLISVFGSAGERDRIKRPEMGRIAVELSDIVILTAEDPRTEKVRDIIKEIRSGVPENYKNVYEEPDRKDAINFALKTARSGDTVGIFGKGHEKSMNLDGKTEIPWSDQKAVKDFLKNIKDE